jgi:transposase-like protein
MESYDSWVEFFRHMQRRGFRIPLLVTSDGAPGLITAVAESFSESKRQWCTFHKLQNIRNKLPQEVIDELYPEIRSVLYQTNAEIAKMYAAKIID